MVKRTMVMRKKMAGEEDQTNSLMWRRQTMTAAPLSSSEVRIHHSCAAGEEVGSGAAGVAGGRRSCGVAVAGEASRSEEEEGPFRWACQGGDAEGRQVAGREGHPDK